VLTARAGRAVGIDAQVLGVDVDLLFLALVQLGHNLDQRERGVPAVVLVEGRDPHEPVHTVLRPQQAISALAAEDHRGALEPGFLTG